ncbi:WAT1-related protein At4g08290-like [Phalaenopsis equestris]|uniref:WAT1-related protein At4g08290-like n=1 Tax=Phalaenopsis equestris TaxID=78828 RepID=UPI0009E19E89|nr:WAT1-related protein At4g08290-like [Phalaenopsis equestris]
MLSKETNGRVKLVLKKMKPYAAMVFLQFSIAVMYVILMATLKEGMNQSVMFAYRSLVATTFIAPFALWFERNGRPKITLIIFVKVMALGILQPVLDQNCYLLGAKLTSAGFASALENINPAITFVICLLLRMEKLNIRRKQGVAKVIGAILGVIGAIVMILYKGPIVEFFWSQGRENHSEVATANDEAGNSTTWIKGILIIFISCLSWSSFIILQANTLKSYPAKLSLTAMVCSFGAVINGVIALVVTHGSFRPWILGWDLRLFAVIYSGLVGNAFWYFMLGVVTKEKGPVFASAFNPLTMIMTNVLSSTFLAEKIVLGTIIGASILVAGMYFILWGKSKDFTVELESVKSIEEPELPVVKINNVDGQPKALRFEPTLIHIQETKQESFPQKDQVLVLDFQ